MTNVLPLTSDNPAMLTILRVSQFALIWALESPFAVLVNLYSSLQVLGYLTYCKIGIRPFHFPGVCRHHGNHPEIQGKSTLCD